MYINLFFSYYQFNLNGQFEINRNILKCDHIRYLPSERSSINTANSQLYIYIPREDSVISLVNSFLDINFDVLHAATGKRYTSKNDVRLVILGVIGLFSKYNLSSGSGKQLEDISHAHIVLSMYKLITSARDTDDLSIGFDRYRGRRQRELTKNKLKKVNFILDL